MWKSILDGFSTSRGDFTHTALPDALVGADNASTLSAATLQRYEYIVNQADPLAIQHSVGLFTVDMRAEMQRLGEESCVPILCVHGSNDAGMPYEASTKLIQDLVPRVQVKLYDGAAHGKWDSVSNALYCFAFSGGGTVILTCD